MDEAGCGHARVRGQEALTQSLRMAGGRAGRAGWYDGRVRTTRLAGPLVALVVLAGGCRTRPLDLLPGPGEEGGTDGASDASLRDLAPPIDHALPPDLTPPPDLTRPRYCNGIYVFTSNDELIFLDPVDFSFTSVALLACAPGRKPFSMGVGQDGRIWVEYYVPADASAPTTLYRLDVANHTCVPTPFKNPGDPFGHFGMGFASDGVRAVNETLYVGGYDFTGNGSPPTLGRLDLTTFRISRIGPLPGRSELTGTGAGELWAFFAEAHPHVSRIDPMTGNVIRDIPVPQPGDLTDAAFAFATWGGDFYAFATGGPGGMNSTVWQIHQADGAVKMVVPNARRQIVGAGVSTCAPFGLDGP